MFVIYSPTKSFVHYLLHLNLFTMYYWTPSCLTHTCQVLIMTVHIWQAPIIVVILMPTGYPFWRVTAFLINCRTQSEPVLPVLLILLMTNLPTTVLNTVSWTWNRLLLQPVFSAGVGVSLPNGLLHRLDAWTATDHTLYTIINYLSYLMPPELKALTTPSK